METAMQKLQRRLFDVNIRQNPITVDEMNGFIELEKQQIIDAFNDASLEGDKIGSAYYELEFKPILP